MRPKWRIRLPQTITVEAYPYELARAIAEKIEEFLFFSILMGADTLEEVKQLEEECKAVA